MKYLPLPLPLALRSRYTADHSSKGILLWPLQNGNLHLAVEHALCCQIHQKGNLLWPLHLAVETLPLPLHCPSPHAACPFVAIPAAQSAFASVAFASKIGRGSHASAHSAPPEATTGLQPPGPARLPARPAALTETHRATSARQNRIPADSTAPAEYDHPIRIGGLGHMKNTRIHASTPRS